VSPLFIGKLHHLEDYMNAKDIQFLYSRPDHHGKFDPAFAEQILGKGIKKGI
jgi:hypothetical protein